MSTLLIASLTQKGPSTMRLSYSSVPLQANPVGKNDALNSGNYSVTNGVLTVPVGESKSVPGSPTDFDLILSGVLTIGTWTVTVKNIQKFDGTPLVSPFFISIVVTAQSLSESVTQGTKEDNAGTTIRKNFNPTLKGPAFNALLEAIASGDSINWQNAALAYKQIFISTASGIYLDRLMDNIGFIRPANIGISDDSYRQLGIKTTADKLTQQSLLDVLEVFYGTDAVKAFDQTASFEPFALNDGDDLRFTIDELNSFIVTFNSVDFASIGQAEAIEIATVITRFLKINNSSAYAISATDPQTGLKTVKIYSGSSGLVSSVRVSGGKAQNILNFSDKINAYSSPGSLPTWNITVDVANNITRFTSVGATNLDLNNVVIGNYVNIYGSEFLASNRGSFPIININIAYPGGTLTQYFEILNTGTQQLGLAQTLQNDIIFYQATKRGIYQNNNRTVVVAQHDGIVDVVVPVTTQAITRTVGSGAYLHSNPAQSISTLIRSFGGTVTATSTAHGLSQGDQIIVDNVFGKVSPPTVTAGTPSASPSTSDASFKTIWSILKVTPTTATRYHTSTTMADGRVLITGGENFTGATTVIKKSVIFQSVGYNTLTTGQQLKYNWQSAADYPTIIEWHAAILFPPNVPNFNNVLVSGGWDGAGTIYNTSNLYDPIGDAWNATGNLNVARVAHGINKSTNGSIMVSGGLHTDPNTTTNTTEIYDYFANTWSSTTAMNTARCQHEQLSLNNNKTLVVGGRTLTAGHLNFSDNTDMGPILSSCEVFDPIGVTWINTGMMTYARFGHRAIVVGDKVVVMGGWGYNPTQLPLTPAVLNTVEMWDANNGLWIPLPPMFVPRAFMIAEYNSTLNRIYVAGGTTDLRTEYLDLNNMQWYFSSATLAEQRSFSRSSQLSDGNILLSGGNDISGHSSANNDVLLIGSDRICNGKLNGIFTVDSVVDANNFIYSTPNVVDYTANNSTGCTFTPFKAQPGGAILGPYIYNPKQGFGISGVQSTITMNIVAGNKYNILSVADATVFPDTPGWVIINYGNSNQTAPVKYLSKFSETALLLDFNFIFSFDVASGASVAWLLNKSPFVPAHPELVGSFYLTSSNAGRVAAQSLLSDIIACSQQLNVKVEYPSDIGLGGAGFPTRGAQKLSSIVNQYSSDNFQNDLMEARQTPNIE